MNTLNLVSKIKTAAVFISSVTRNRMNLIFYRASSLMPERKVTRTLLHKVQLVLKIFIRQIYCLPCKATHAAIMTKNMYTYIMWIHHLLMIKTFSCQVCFHIIPTLCTVFFLRPLCFYLRVRLFMLILLTSIADKFVASSFFVSLNLPPFLI